MVDCRQLVQLGFVFKSDRLQLAKSGLGECFLGFLINQKEIGKKVVGYGAAAKGSTLLNYCGVKSDLVEFVADASVYKQGRFMPGSHIPIVDESFISKERPDFIIIFPWNIKEEIIKQLSYVNEWNGKFVTAIPRLQIG